MGFGKFQTCHTRTDVMLSFYFLGLPRLERDGCPVEVDTRKAIALLAYLALMGSQSRDALAALFWPEYDQSHARAGLRRTLSALNKALAGEGLLVDRENVGLDPTAVIRVDVLAFRAHIAACDQHGHPPAEVCPACLSPLAKAAVLYRDDFLAGFSLRDAAGFDDWQFFQSESLRRELAAVLEKLVRGYHRQGNQEAAITAARRWLALDPLQEPAHRQLMLLYAWAGERAAALRQYRECVRVLDEELGVPPLEETTALYERIQAGELDKGTRGETERVIARSVSPLPLVGRDEEQEQLRAAYETIRADGRWLVIEGEAGIGKTRLAEEFLNWARASGKTVLAAHCYEGESHLAYSPIIESLRPAVNQGQLAHLPSHWLSEAARLWPELEQTSPGLPAAPPLDNPGAQSRFFEGVSQLLLALSRSEPAGILFLDNLHWADEASLDLLTYLVRRLRGRPLFLLATWRAGQLAPDHRLRHLLAEGQRAGLASLITLDRLDEAAVQSLLAAYGKDEGGRIKDEGMPFDSQFGRRLYQETEGLPFFLVEYLANLEGQAGKPQIPNPKSQPLNPKSQIPNPKSESPISNLQSPNLQSPPPPIPASPASWPMPTSVRDLLRSRLAAVSETGWQLLNTAAVIGRSFDFDTLREASGRSEEETITALEELLARRLIEEINHPLALPSAVSSYQSSVLSYDFNHEKLRTLVYEETSLARRRLLHRRVAEALAPRSRQRPHLAGQIAYHYQQAGEHEPAAEFFKQAGDQAAALYANQEALAHYRAALALGHPGRALLQEAIGDLHTLQGEYNQALASYQTAAALQPDPGQLSQLEHKLGKVYQRQGEWALAGRHFAAAQASNSQPQASLYADWSLTAHHAGESGRAQTLAQQAWTVAEAAGDSQAQAHAHNILGILAKSAGDLPAARYHLEQSLALAEPGARAAALNNLALLALAEGESGRALALAQEALALCVAQGDRHREAALRSNLADMLHAAGRSEEAMAHLKQSVAIYAEIGGEAGAWQPEIWKLTEW
jgi:DNA-binding SARP family transcriptional activator/predicted ATPase